jgi:AcrR family transcriptional regulator
MIPQAASALMTAAEQLFAQVGIDGPSLREINRVAGQANTNALQYHFGDRDGLLRAVLERHAAMVDAQRDALLDLAELEGDLSPRTMSTALVFPLLAKLDDADGGPEYLQIAAEVMARPGRFADLRSETMKPMVRWATLVEPCLPPEAIGRPLHRRYAALRFTYGELATRARDHHGGDHRLFANHLVDLVVALLTAPVSEDTLKSIKAKDRSLALTPE